MSKAWSDALPWLSWLNSSSGTSEGASAVRSNHNPRRSCSDLPMGGSSSMDSSNATTPNCVRGADSEPSDIRSGGKDCVSMACVMGAIRAAGKRSAMLMQTTP